MSLKLLIMKTLSVSAEVYAEPTEDENRDYAYHLYEQSGCIPGRDLENWLEASACLKANVPRRPLQGVRAGEHFGADVDAVGRPRALAGKE